MNSISTSQNEITAGRDNAGRDIHNNSSNSYNIALAPKASPIAAWMEKLADEIKHDRQVIDFIDTLQMYRERHSDDGIDGLINKLTHSGRTADINLALKKKELFTRLLTKYQMFDSAQQIFAYLLAKLEQDFRTYIVPNIQGSPAKEVDELFHQYLIEPCADEIKSGVFCLNAAIASGMIYWLAEQCYIRWHA